jgi:hypothetical protein
MSTLHPLELTDATWPVCRMRSDMLAVPKVTLDDPTSTVITDLRRVTTLSACCAAGLRKRETNGHQRKPWGHGLRPGGPLGSSWPERTDKALTECICSVPARLRRNLQCRI